jgi:hypothetical protein
MTNTPQHTKEKPMKGNDVQVAMPNIGVTVVFKYVAAWWKAKAKARQSWESRFAKLGKYVFHELGVAVLVAHVHVDGCLFVQRVRRRY